MHPQTASIAFPHFCGAGDGCLTASSSGSSDAPCAALHAAGSRMSLSSSSACSVELLSLMSLWRTCPFHFLNPNRRLSSSWRCSSTLSSSRMSAILPLPPSPPSAASCLPGCSGPMSLLLPACPAVSGRSPAQSPCPKIAARSSSSSCPPLLLQKPPHLLRSTPLRHPLH